MEKGKIAAKQPVKTDLKAGKTYAWCSCGLSTNQPFCNGLHVTTDMSPLIFKAKKDETVWLCQCKQTNNPPYCDGSHKNL